MHFSCSCCCQLLAGWIATVYTKKDQALCYNGFLILWPLPAWALTRISWALQQFFVPRLQSAHLDPDAVLEPEELPPTCLPRVFSGKEKEVSPSRSSEKIIKAQQQQKSSTT